MTVAASRQTAHDSAPTWEERGGICWEILSSRASQTLLFLASQQDDAAPSPPGPVSPALPLLRQEEVGERNPALMIAGISLDRSTPDKQTIAGLDHLSSRLRAKPVNHSGGESKIRSPKPGS